MLYRESPPTQSHILCVRNDIPPFDDIRVRKEAMLAIDQPSMKNDLYHGNAYTFTWPIQPVFTDVYTSPEELPQEIKELYGYHPDKARDLLTQAGYPAGFRTKLYVYPSADDMGSCQEVAQYLADVGIDAEIVVPETAGTRLIW